MRVKGDYAVAIRNNATGEVRLCRAGVKWDDTESSVFWWTDGNMGCDCNRALYFYAWGPEADDLGCGDTAFSTLYAKTDDGRIIPIDEDGTGTAQIRPDQTSPDVNKQSDK